MKMKEATPVMSGYRAIEKYGLLPDEVEMPERFYVVVKSNGKAVPVECVDTIEFHEACKAALAKRKRGAK